MERPSVAVDDTDARVPVVETVRVDGGTPLQRGKRQRLLALDLMRGLIMIVMAWDHTKDIWVSKAWSPKSRGAEGWEGEFSTYDNNWWLFFARAISNLSAPGFFFTMGMSMSMFTVVRKQQGWFTSQIVKHFSIRAVVLLLVGRIINAPFGMARIAMYLKGEDVPTQDSWIHPHHPVQLLVASFLSSFQVMTGLGLTMATALLVLLPLYHVDKSQYNSDQASGRSEIEEEEWTPSAEVSLLPNNTENEMVARRKSWAKMVLWDSISTAEWAAYALFTLFYIFSNTMITAAQGDDFYTPLHNVTFPDTNLHAETVWQTIQRLYMYPGYLPNPFGHAAYPVFPWIAVTTLGIGFGFSLKRHPDATIRRLGVLSLVFLGLFLIVRFFGGSMGNLRGLPRGDGVREGYPHVDKLLAFFIMSKYPPSLAFTLFYVGIDSGIIYGFFRSMTWYPAKRDELSSKWAPVLFFWDTCKIFGEVPLFFYIMHFWILGPLSFVACLITDDFRLSLPLCAVLWIFVLGLLRPLCAQYGAFKATTAKNSWWRLL